ncbi:MAG TPA: cyanophycinase, partial [Pirellulaceae bacterium]|nr:cyanophycinase [Pirellulaceae bacterium]
MRSCLPLILLMVTVLMGATDETRADDRDKPAVASAAATQAKTPDAASESRGRLVIIGGGLRRENAAIFERLVHFAGGVDSARFVVLPTASNNDRGARNFRDNLARYGVPAERCSILNVFVANAATSTSDETTLELVRRSTGLFMTGGDQTRIVKALVKADGAETPLLSEIRKLLARGGVIAGSSAGAAVQSVPMISASGLPDEMLDEGFAALDFGLTDNLERPGLHVSKGLGFFTGGVIDQHFHQYRGRLGRLARVTTQRGIPFGFGIDENTALVVAGDGACEVVGPGNVTLVDARRATCEDGALGCRVSGVRVSLLAQGDRWAPSRNEIVVHSAKRPIAVGKEASIGGFLIPDINGEGAAPLALTAGLADNSQVRQRAIALKHHDGHSHGYRFTFSKTADTRSLDGYVDGVFSYSVVNVELKIEPIDGRLRSPEKSLPSDLVELPSGPTRTALEALWFRGILPVDDSGLLKPESPLTRTDLAKMLARSVHLLPPRVVTLPPDVDA